MKNLFSQYSESDTLKEVIVGQYQGYASQPEYIEIVNEEQRSGLPDISTLKHEFEQLIDTLEKHDILVHQPEYVGRFVYDQLTPRDLGVAIGNRFLICNMVKKSRRYEAAGIFPLLRNKQGPEPVVIIPPPEVLIEGGDIIIDRGVIYAGISQRTNKNALNFLQDVFGEEFSIQPVYCKRLDQDENVLHLDCTFNPIGQGKALIYPDGIDDIPAPIRDYDWIEVTREEQALLGTNVLSLDTHTIISRDHPGCARVNDTLRREGFRVIELTFNGAPATGGSFRCCTLPLFRHTEA